MRRIRTRVLPPAGLAVLASAALLLPASAWGTSLLVVTNTNDSGAGSLRAEITAANASPGSTIVFNIPESDPGFNAGGGWFSIVPLTQLPILTANTTIDGSTQTAFTGDTNPAGPEIFLDGRLAVLDESPVPPRSLWIESSSTVEGLTVSGFAGDEIYISGANGAVVRGDYVGTDPTGTSVISPPNDLRTFENEGVQVVDASTNTLIGGTSAADRNVISGNTGSGIYMSSPDNGVVIEGNYIGTNATGTAALGNGIGVAAGPDGNWASEPGPSNVTIGGTAPGAGNVISGNGLGGPNGNSGIGLAGPDVTGITVQGNFIGTDASGSHAIPNVPDGIVTYGDLANTVIGGTTPAARNVISGNGGAGIDVFASFSAGSGILGNYIGTDETGAHPLGNTLAGIVLDGATNAVIGGVPAGAGNVISGNGDSGISIGSGTTGSVIEDNYVGTDATGALALGNQGSGVDVQAANATIGAGNVLSGNAWNGVNVGDGVAGTVVKGNYIGTNAAGTAALGNGQVGIGIDGSASNTIVGGTDPGAGNVISGNRVGVDMPGGTPSHHEPTATTIQGNLIGTDATGTYAIGNTAAGIGTAAAGSLLIGGAASGARNVISGNQVGLNLGEVVGAVVEGNDIGTNLAGAAVPNAFDGVQLMGSGNEVEANTIADNGGDGVDIFAVPSDPIPIDDAISRNSIFSNGNLGIDLNGDGVTLNNCCGHSGPNDYENFPVLTSAVSSGGHVTVVGTLDTASPHTAVVELFADPQPVPGGNWSGYGEGAVFLGTVTPAANGSFTATLPSFAPGALISATATDSAGNTSEFSQDIWLTSPAPPVVSSFSPNHGTVGTSVTITGSGFAGATAVAFGGTAATDVSVDSDSTITATVAAGTSTGPVSVTAPGGTTTSSALFYLPPSIGGFSPTNAAEHTTVTVTGTNLVGTTRVQLGGVDVPFSVASNGRLTFTVPTGSAGGTIHVTAPGGTATSAGSVTILPPPTITSISPGSGPVGTTVTITGTNLGGTVGVMLGSVVTVPTSVSPTSVTFTLPPGAASGHVKVLTTSGSATSTDTFTVTG